MFNVVKKLFGTKQDRDVKGYMPRVEEVNGYFDSFQGLSHDELRGKTTEFRERIAAHLEGIDKDIAGTKEKAAETKDFGEKEQNYCLGLLKDVRANGISSELYPSAAKMKKQMKYANDKRVHYVALVGENEMNNEMVLLKDMASGEQEEMSIEEVISKLK